MAAIEIFSSSAAYKYKSRICSFTSIVVLLFIVLSVITPLFVVYHAGGIWMKNRMHVETPAVHFEYKYLLLANVDAYEEPIVCTTFTTYKENKIPDECSIIKVQEEDVNGDGQKNSLKFEAHFYTDKPVKSIKLLLFFNFELKHLVQASIKSIGVFDHVLNDEVQEIRFFGDLELRQKGLLSRGGLYDMYNESLELSDYSLPELIFNNARINQSNLSVRFPGKKNALASDRPPRPASAARARTAISRCIRSSVSARITNERVSYSSGFSNDETAKIIGELFYAESFIHYQLSLWEELKWAWVQYLSCLLVFAYVSKHILAFLLANRYLSAYIVKPWANR